MTMYRNILSLLDTLREDDLRLVAVEMLELQMYTVYMGGGEHKDMFWPLFFN